MARKNISVDVCSTGSFYGMTHMMILNKYVCLLYSSLYQLNILTNPVQGRVVPRDQIGYKYHVRFLTRRTKLTAIFATNTHVPW